MDIEKFKSMLKQIKVLSDKLEVKKLRGNNDYSLFLALATKCGCTRALSARCLIRTHRIIKKSYFWSFL